MLLLSLPRARPNVRLMDKSPYAESNVSSFPSRLGIETEDPPGIRPGFPILGVFRLKGQPKRDDGMIFGSCKASQTPVYPIRDAIRPGFVSRYEFRRVPVCVPLSVSLSRPPSGGFPAGRGRVCSCARVGSTTKSINHAGHRSHRDHQRPEHLPETAERGPVPEIRLP